MKVWQYITVGMVFLLGIMGLYAAYALLSIQIHLMFSQLGIVLVLVLFGLSSFLFRIAYNLFKYARKS